MEKKITFQGELSKRGGLFKGYKQTKFQVDNGKLIWEDKGRPMELDLNDCYVELDKKSKRGFKLKSMT